MISSRHPFVVQLHFAFQCSYFWVQSLVGTRNPMAQSVVLFYILGMISFNTTQALVMEYCPNGDLQAIDKLQTCACVCVCVCVHRMMSK